MATDPNINIRELIARIDERTLTLLKSHESLKVTLESQVDHLYTDIEKHYTKRSDFEPVKKLVFGFVGFILLSVGGMFIGLIVKSNNAASMEPPPAIMRQVAPSMPKEPPPQSLGK